MILLKSCTQYASKFGKLSSGHRTEKGQFSFQSQRKVMPKNVQITIQLCSFHMLGRLCSKCFKLGFNSTWIKNLQMYKLDLEKQRNQRSNCQHLLDHRKSQGIKKKIYFSFTDYAKPLTVWITTNYGKFLKSWEYQTTLPVSWETCMQVEQQQLELDMEQWTGSKLGKEYMKAVYCHPAYLTYMQNKSCEMPR